MAPSAEQIQALADAVAAWRMQEYTYISFYCFYVYYVLTTMAEEVSIIFPQRWNRGKMLYATIRYGTILYIALQLIRDYRNYFVISPGACKAVLITYTAVHWVTYVASDFSLALCLSALLQTRAIYLAGIVILSCGNRLSTGIFNLISDFQYAAEPVSLLDADLGYPCYAGNTEEVMENTVFNLGRNVRSYVNLVATACLALLGIVTLVARYKGQGSHLLQVIRRDGGIHFLSLVAIRVVSATLWTPGVVPVAELYSNPALLAFNMAYIIIPILPTPPH
ncbi:hypothetical protein FA13DRAFT_1823768 [Coprinellus micaceus]|uniref:DUF6533 domain-containing protein n=1 Tax=Coprinellus micaceus TaxID=71717 RepID=A0A4Y7RRK3_COPMI|nr:hypothetical protein FA13DRAFT_1823768 [Coprinellus micaceus]